MTRFATLTTGPRIAFRDVRQGLPLLLGHGFMLDSELLAGHHLGRPRRGAVPRWSARCSAEEHAVEEDNDNGGT